MVNSKKKLWELLRSDLDPEFTVWKLPHASRTLLLKDVANDLQVGFKIDKGKLRGEWVESVDIGVRIPSVEELYDQFETYSLRKMGFREAEPSGWLTFWRPTYSSVELEEQALSIGAIRHDFAMLYDSIHNDPQSFRSQLIDLLTQARRPEWATYPGGTFLITKALVARTLEFPDVDACEFVNELTANEPILDRDEIIIERVCEWLRAVHSAQNSPE